jgi:hypothetical protein
MQDCQGTTSTKVAGIRKLVPWCGTTPKTASRS